MYSICFHISAISIIEIIFYFYYIAPMETKIFNNTFDKAIYDLDLDRFDSILTLPQQEKNIFIEVENTTLDELENQMEKAEKEKNEYNHNLFINTIIYWSIFTSLIIPIFFIQVFIERRIKKKKLQQLGYDSDDSFIDNEQIELILFKRLRKTSIDESEIEINTVDQSDDNVSLINKIKSNKKYRYLYTSIRYILLGGGIVTFQYIFFNEVILKYHILTNQQLQYTILKNIFPKLNEILFN